MKFWNFDSIQRDSVYQTLLGNCMNRNITKIVIIIERYTPITLIHNKIEVIKIDGDVDDQFIFNLSYRKYPNKLCCISDSNLLFETNVSELYRRDMSGVVIWDGKWIFKSFRLPIYDNKNNNLRFNFDSGGIKIKSLVDFINDVEIISNVNILNKVTSNKIIEIPKLKSVILPKLCIIIHLYYQDLWSEFENLLKNMEGIDYDLYVSLVENSSTLGQTIWMKNKIEKVGGVVYILPNKGLDIGPFLYILRDIIKSNKSYDQIIKLHSKKSLSSPLMGFGDRWRNILIQSLIGSLDIINNNIDKLRDYRIGMLGSNEWLISNTNGNDGNINMIKEKLGINDGDLFIGGTMFWVKFEILKKYLNLDNISDLYDILEDGYFMDNVPTNTHALERVFGYMVSDSGYKILGV